MCYPLNNMKKKDYIVFAIIFILLIVIYFISNILFSQEGTKADIYCDNVKIGSYNIKEDAVVMIGKNECITLEECDTHDLKLVSGYTNIFYIKNGEVNMIVADCPDKICVNHISINKVGESIVCMPNKVYIAIE